VPWRFTTLFVSPTIPSIAATCETVLLLVAVSTIASDQSERHLMLAFVGVKPSTLKTNATQRRQYHGIQRRFSRSMTR
jgi:hypothetical protein